MKRLPKEYRELAAWLYANCGDEAYGRRPDMLDAVFASIRDARKSLQRPLNSRERYRGMTVKEKLEFRLNACRTAIEDRENIGLKALSWKLGVPTATLRRWMIAYRAGGISALRFDYSQVGRKKKV